MEYLTINIIFLPYSCDYSIPRSFSSLVPVISTFDVPSTVVEEEAEMIVVDEEEDVLTTPRYNLFIFSLSYFHFTKKFEKTSTNVFSNMHVHTY